MAEEQTNLAITPILTTMLCPGQKNCLMRVRCTQVASVVKKVIINQFPKGYLPIEW